MAEFELHHEETHDSKSQRIGLLAAILAVLLALVTIASHRAHTRAVLLRSEANDQWQYRQASRIKFHDLELGEDLLATLGEKNPDAQKLRDKYEAEKARYDAQSRELQNEARRTEAEVAGIERRAMRFDIGEGLLEIGVVLTSLYFISLRSLFPAVGLTAGVGGAIVALTGLLV